MSISRYSAVDGQGLHRQRYCDNDYICVYIHRTDQRERPKPGNKAISLFRRNSFLGIMLALSGLIVRYLSSLPGSGPCCRKVPQELTRLCSHCHCREGQWNFFTEKAHKIKSKLIPFVGKLFLCVEPHFARSRPH